MLFPMKCGLNSLKKNWIRLGISAAPGIEGSVSTSANHKDNEPAVTSSDNWPGGLFRTSPKHWDGAPDVVLSSATQRDSLENGAASGVTCSSFSKYFPNS